MNRYKVDITGLDTNKLKVISRKEMEKLFVLIQSSTNKLEIEMARDKLVMGNLRLVLSVLKRFNNRAENIDDLFQVGCVGLLKAIDNFSLEHGVRFSTYAVPMVIGEIRRHLRDNNPIRVSRSLKDIAYKVLQMREKMISERDQEPTDYEIAKELGIEPIDVILALEAIQDPVSIFSPIYNDGGDTIHLIDQIEDKSITDSSWNNQILIDTSIKRLEERERQIILDRYFMGKTQMEIAEEIGISQAQVSRLEKSALRNMNDYLK